jgi:hypothetical protein
VSHPDDDAPAACFDRFTTKEANVIPTVTTTAAARVGDSVEVTGLPGKPPKRGQILEVLGAGEHVHFRVRWDEQHESLLYPTEGATVVHPAGKPR